MTARQTDYLIIGQGIAGTFFAHELAQHQRDFIVIDAGGHNASKTAAGMYNPVVLKRFSPVWQAAAQIDTARQTVAMFEELLGDTFDYPLPIQRIFHDEGERTTWGKKASEPQLSDFLGQAVLNNDNPRIRAPLGLGNVGSGGRIDVRGLLTAYRQQLISHGQLFAEDFDYQQLVINDDHVIYGDIRAEKIIFCEGYGIKRNLFFNHLPLNGNKGEVLTVRIPDLNVHTAIKSNVFIMPLPERGADVYFVGATYNWTDKDSVPSEAVRAQLLERLSQFIDGEIEVLSHRAGIRPTVADRRPLLGQHPVHQPLYIMNGLGTRGVMLGATMAKWLYQFIVHDTALPHVVDCQRFDLPPR